MKPTDFSNRFAVGVEGHYIMIASPVQSLLSKEDALLLAAYLAVLADDGTAPAAFSQVLCAVARGTV